ncbi:MAG: ATP-dependent Clp protease ATP-binding subunit ClpX, partial [Defluviitaleaceae bacterium]|nr:ATP-dependent Clp protease ATP-binding subunit ClpX [Defluviitaleaceae bacterium]
IEQRQNKKVIGFNSEIKTKKELLSDDPLADLQPGDLQKYGLIPELVGRLPIVVTLQALDEAALLRILTEPKNALTKQYKYLFELDNIHLEFEADALTAIAQRAIARETGARGLRAIVEDFMTDIMYEVPSDDTVERCVITKDTVENKTPPLIIYNEKREPIVRKGRKKKSQRATAG